MATSVALYRRWFGAAVAAVSTVVLVGALWVDVRSGTALGWAEVAALVGWFGGAVLFAIGVLGIYVYKIHTEVRGRPLYLVRHSMNLEQEPRA